MKRTIIVFSGGLDSTCLLAKLRDEGREVKCISIDYGQKHRRELEAAAKICALLGVEHRVADLSGLRPLLGGSSQTDDSVAVPHGNYDEPSMAVTVVPNRNMVLLAVAGMWAISTKSDSIAYAAHAGDHAQYADCRSEFVDPMAQAMRNADWHKVEIERPFLNVTKADIVRIGSQLPNGVELMATSYSCYEGGEVHCGSCGTCRERRSAFRDAGVPDPTAYLPEGLREAPITSLPKL